MRPIKPLHVRRWCRTSMLLAVGVRVRVSAAHRVISASNNAYGSPAVSCFYHEPSSALIHSGTVRCDMEQPHPCRSRNAHPAAGFMEADQLALRARSSYIPSARLLSCRTLYRLQSSRPRTVRQPLSQLGNIHTLPRIPRTVALGARAGGLARGFLARLRRALGRDATALAAGVHVGALFAWSELLLLHPGMADL